MNFSTNRRTTFMVRMFLSASIAAASAIAIAGQQAGEERTCQANDGNASDLCEIIRLEAEWNRMNEVSDAEGKERLLASDSYHVGPSGRLYNKSQDIEAARQSRAQKEASGTDLKFLITNRRIRMYTDAAVVTLTGTSFTTRDGVRKQGSTFRAVHVWEKRDGRWQLAVDQVTGVAR